MENEILKKLNEVAKDYQSSKNLIKNINKKYSSMFKIISCEETGVGYRNINVLDNDNKSYKYKLFENNNQVEFKLYSSKETYTTNELWEILKSGKITIAKDFITIELDDLSFEDYDIMLKGLGKR